MDIFSNSVKIWRCDVVKFQILSTERGDKRGVEGNEERPLFLAPLKDVAVITP